jgi:hypothetical protein
MKDYSLSEETLGYTTSPESSNTNQRFLVAGSKNVLVDYQKKVKSRSGYTRLGAANTALTNVRNAWTWDTSTGQKFPQRFYDDELEVYLGTVDTTEINAWTRVKAGWSTTEKLRQATWFDTTENIDLQIMVQGDANMYEWGGGVAVITSITSNTITKAGTTTFAQNRFYATRVSIGGSTSQFDITNPAGNTYRYTWDGTGTDPGITAAKYPVGMAISIQAQNFNAGNKGTFLITGSGANYFEVTNASGVAEVDKTIGTGNIDIKSVVVCVRTGVEYGYTGGEATTALTGVNDTTGLVAGDILVQKVYTKYNAPGASHANHTIFSFENQIVIGSEDDEEVYISKNTDYSSFAFSSPRVAGEGALLTLDDPTRAINSLGSLLLIFAGRSSIFKIQFEQIAVSTTLAETLKIKKLDTGIDQGALNHECVVPIGNALAFLTNEVALRIIENPENLTGINPKTFSNPIKPDFDAEDWDNAFGTWYKNILIFTAPEGSRMYMLNFVEDADGKLFRFWNPPQVLPVGPMTVIDSGDGPLLHGHSNSIPETYLLFDGASDGQYSGMEVIDKLPIDAKAVFAYNDYKKRGLLKTFDEYYVEGEITPSTTILTLDLNYDFAGDTQQIQKNIDGSDEDIMEGQLGFNSLAQQSLAVNPMGGFLNSPTDARKFRVVLEIPKEDFHLLQATFSTNDVDKYWAIIAHGANATLSQRKNTLIRK